MDHLLRNRGRGGFGLPVSTLSRIARLARCGFFFGLLNGQQHRPGSAKGGHFLQHGVPEGQQVERWPSGIHGDGCASVEVDFVPTVGHHIAPMHVADQHGAFSGPRHVGPRRFMALSRGQVACQHEAVVAGLICGRLCFARRKCVQWRGMGQPCMLPKPGRKQEPARGLEGVLVAARHAVFAWGVLVRVGDEQVVEGRVRGESVSRGRFDDGLQTWESIDDRVSRHQRFEVLCKRVHVAVHVEAHAAFGVPCSWMRIDAHDQGRVVDVV